MEKIKIAVIAGPTASGKTELGVEIAKSFDGEVISADSMQIYKGMDIATAKPTHEEMGGIPHHLIDFLERDRAFSVADYVELANEKINEIHKRGRLPVIVGGTGLYISSLIDNIQLINYIRFFFFKKSFNRFFIRNISLDKSEIRIFHCFFKC